MKNPDVEFYFTKEEKWQREIVQLRSLVLDCGLTEELKWGCPCYTFQQSNIVLIHVFKNYCALLFFKGALLQDADSLLIQQTKNVQAARQLRFTNVAEIEERAALVKAYIYEAIEVEKAGLRVTMKITGEIAEEFQKRLNNNAVLQSAFLALTPGRQRAYHLYFSAPKQAKTRSSRVEKCIPQILAGKGLND